MSDRFVVKRTSDTNKPAASVAVVICTHNRPAELECCLRGLQQVKEPTYSVIVVDSAPKSSDAQTVTARYGARYILSPLKGLSRARNIGTRAADADIVAYLDDDMVPHTRWLNSLIAEFSDRNAMAATGPVLSLGLSDGSDVDLQLAVELAPLGSNRFEIDKSSRQWFERTNFGGIGDGNFALRRIAFDKIGGFDERLGRGATIDTSEDHYAYFKLVENGSKIVYSPSAVVFHPILPASRDLLKKRTADTVAFAAFLAWCHPAYAWRVTKFLLEGTFGVRRWWHASSKFEVTSISAAEKFFSGMNGLSIFWRSVRQTIK
jgi:GT2 family glycosyltransferase